MTDRQHFIQGKQIAALAGLCPASITRRRHALPATLTLDDLVAWAIEQTADLSDAECRLMAALQRTRSVRPQEAPRHETET